MIKFFRKIRQKLLVENRFNKYLIYAVGEIVLVVIGILIALYINNKNEQNKKDVEANKVLAQIQDDLLNTVENMQSQRRFYKMKDSIYRIIKSDTLSVSDMMNPENFEIHRFTYDYAPYLVPKEGLNSFVNKVDQFSEKYTSLEPEIKRLYAEFTFYYDASQGVIEDVLNRQYAFARSQKWYSNVWSRADLKEEFVDYLLNDYRYKNEVETYRNFIFGISGVTVRFELKAMLLYQKIHDITKEPKEIPDLVKDYFNPLPASFVEKLVGTYEYQDKNEPKPVKIEFKNNQLFFDGKPAYMNKDNEILLEDFPVVNVWKYDPNDQSLSFALLSEERTKRFKVQ